MGHGRAKTERVACHFLLCVHGSDCPRVSLAEQNTIAESLCCDWMASSYIVQNRENRRSIWNLELINSSKPYIKEGLPTLDPPNYINGPVSSIRITDLFTNFLLTLSISCFLSFYEISVLELEHGEAYFGPLLLLNTTVTGPWMGVIRFSLERGT